MKVRVPAVPGTAPLAAKFEPDPFAVTEGEVDADNVVRDAQKQVGQITGQLNGALSGQQQPSPAPGPQGGGKSILDQADAILKGGR